MTDCLDEATRARQLVRASTLFPEARIHFCGVSSTLEAGGIVVDLLAAAAAPTIVLVNVAPRDGSGKQWPNGVPFGYVEFRGHFIFGTVGEFVFSFLQKLTGTPIAVHCFDIPQALPFLGIPKEEQERLRSTQFRSLWFLPLVARQVTAGVPIPTTPYSAVPPLPDCVWYIDNFGNAKTSLIPEEIGFAPGQVLRFTLDSGRELSLPCYAFLKDVPNSTPAVIIGSSGFLGKQFLECVIQDVRPEINLRLASGMQIVDYCMSTAI